MKPGFKIFVIFLMLFSLGALFTIGPVLAVSPADSLNAAAPDAIKNAGDLPTVVGVFIKAVLGLLGVILLALLVYAGFMWGLAAGDANKIKKAKEIIIAALIGLGLTLAAYAISAFIIQRVNFF